MSKKNIILRIFAATVTIAILTTAYLLVFGTRSRLQLEPYEIDETRHIKFYYTSPTNNETDMILKEIIGNFNLSQKKIVVEGYGVSVDKQLVSIMSGNAHDLSYNEWPTAIRWAQNGLLEPLSPYIRKNKFDMGDFLTSTAKMGEYGQIVYSIPFYVQTMALYYNIDMLEKAGFKNPPSSFQELKEMSKKLTITGENGEIRRMGFLPDYPWLDNVLWPVIFGANFFDSQKNQVTTTSKEYVEAIEFQNWFYKEWGWNNISKFKLSFGTGEQEPFCKGKLAMVMGGDWVAAWIKKYAPGLNYGISQFPYPESMPELKNAGMVSARVLCIPAGSKYKNEAWEFLEYLASEKSMTRYAVENSCLMARKSVLNNPEIKDNPDLSLLDILALNENTKGFTTIAIADEYLGCLTEQTQLVFQQKKTAKEAMASVKQEVDEILKK